MRINVHGNDYDLNFTHQQYPVPLALHDNKNANVLVKGHTKCDISEVSTSNSGEITLTTIATGNAYCSAHDNFNKACGRKVSLRNALNKTPFNW